MKNNDCPSHNLSEEAEGYLLAAPRFELILRFPYCIKCFKMSEISMFFNLHAVDNDWKITGSRSVFVRVRVDQIAKYCETTLLKRLRDQFVVAFPQLRQLDSFKITFVSMYILLFTIKWLCTQMLFNNSFDI